MSRPPGRVRVYLACSLDGFIAGPDGDLSWLHEAGADAPDAPDGDALTFDAFLADVGALLMGRTTFDTVMGFGVPWPYGDRSVLVATRRELPEAAPPTVTAAAAPIAELVRQAREAAAGRDVYLDGGELVRQALDAGLVDELVLTVAPVALGAGVPLFAGLQQRRAFDFVAHQPYGRFVQLVVRPRGQP